ncbi:Zinc resistance conferring protein [Mucor velutinosus]|uniref:NudC domain-containing protein 1 n=1 Tax=Mucor velutinosus TaxID=708070 RepID=A0AAN7D7Q4_9FUNG|nr:Zinc resistance conferring protein [Mucor velutinosus]
MNTRFTPNADKLNLKFEGYKLRPFQEATNLIRVPLEGIQVYEPTNDQRLGFRDLQARIRYSNLIYGHPLDQHRGSSFCIDQEFNLHMIVYDKLTRSLETYLITQLIKPLGGVPAFVNLDSTVPIEPQLPSAVSVSRELLLASNGVGDIELIGMEEKGGKMLGTSLASVCYLGVGNEGISPVPCMLLAARQIKTKIVLVVYSRTASKTTEFNIATLELDIPTDTTERLDDGSFVLLLKTLHIQTGPEVPVYCAITPSGNCIFGSEVRYNKIKLLQHRDDDGSAEDGTTTPMDIVENLPKHDAYQWSQEGADITVQFKLPENTPKSAISCKFVVDHVSLLIQNSSISYPFRKLWSTIQPDESLWTLEDNMLTLCMTKVDENTRWPQLFDKDDGVLETLSDQHLSEIKDRLAKLTSENTSSSLVPNHSFVQAAQHPAATDMDEDVDDAGEPVVFGVYDRCGNVVDEFNSGTSRWICSSYEAAHKLPSVCLQMDVDGLVFTLTEVEDKIQIEHTATLDAFAFVQASKRDARFIHHDADLHFASIIESSRNAYLYYHHDDKRLEEVQTLVDLTQGHDVDIMGAQVVHERALLVLTESQLVLICLD